MERHRPALERAGRGASISIGALLVLGVMLGVRFREDRSLGEAGDREASPDVQVSAPVARPAAAWAGLPDPLTLAVLLDDVSSDQPVRAFLRQSGWLGWAVHATEALAAGRVPRELVRSAAPPHRFSVERAGGGTAIAVSSYRRYDTLADAIGGISPVAVRAVFAAVHAPLDAAHRSFGDPSVPFEVVLARALLRIEEAPAPDGEILVRPAGARFVFEDARLEALGDVEKQLLRMGPRNARVLKAKAKEIREALGLPASVLAPAALAR